MNYKQLITNLYWVMRCTEHCLHTNVMYLSEEIRKGSKAEQVARDTYLPVLT